MIFIEKDVNAEEMFIHAAPEDLRGLAKKLWAISQEAEEKGKHKEQLTSKDDSDIELSSMPREGSCKRGVVQKLTISSAVK